MRFQGVLFDLDGTLLDTLADIAGAANAVLKSMDCPQHPVDAYRLMIGDGVRTLFDRILPDDKRSAAIIEQCASNFQETYATSWNAHTQPFRGIPELLDRLTADGVKLAVLSNKPHRFTRLCVDAYLGRWRFEAVFGQREDVPRKPDPAAAHEVAEEMRLPCRDILYVGDTGVDMQTAHNAGMYPVGALWGYRSRDELVQAGAAVLIERPLQLLELFEAEMCDSHGRN